MKKLILVGNLTKDAELRTVKVKEENVSVCTLCVAATNGGGEPSFIEVDVWRGLAETCCKYLIKGSSVAIDADITNHKYEKDGVMHYTYKFTADSVQFLSATKKEKE